MAAQLATQSLQSFIASAGNITALPTCVSVVLESLFIAISVPGCTTNYDYITFTDSGYAASYINCVCDAASSNFLKPYNSLVETLCTDSGSAYYNEAVAANTALGNCCTAALIIAVSASVHSGMIGPGTPLDPATGTTTSDDNSTSQTTTPLTSSSSLISSSSMPVGNTPAATSTNSSSAVSNNSSTATSAQTLSAGSIAGIAVGSFVFVVCAAAVLYWIHRKRQKVFGLSADNRTMISDHTRTVPPDMRKRPLRQGIQYSAVAQQ